MGVEWGTKRPTPMITPSKTEMVSVASIDLTEDVKKAAHYCNEFYEALHSDFKAEGAAEQLTILWFKEYCRAMSTPAYVLSIPEE